jgi:hypothetical protein
VARRRGGRRKPKPGASVVPAKKPKRVLDPEAAKDELISWRLSRVDLDGAWGWRNIPADQVPSLLQKLCDCERLTLGELMQRKGTTQIAVEDLPTDAQKRLVEIKQDDVDAIWHLRLGGKLRVWGIVDRSIFYFLWYDPEHTVYPSTKKGT